LDYSEIYDPDQDFDSYYSRATVKVISNLVRIQDQVLELGCAKGLMTSFLAPRVAKIIAVEQSERYLISAQSLNLSNVEYIHHNLDDGLPVDKFEPNFNFDQIIATNLLHEVSDPIRLLQSISDVMSDQCLLHITIQNPQSLHRFLGHEMKIISDLRSLSDLGQKLGSHGLFDAMEVIDMARDANLYCLFIRGIILKPFPNNMMKNLPTQILDSLTDTALHFPLNSAMNYFVFTKGESNNKVAKI
jgi:SAM-dependent methyltransferase